MIVIRDDLWLCVDCLFCAVNGDTSGCTDDKRAAEVEKAVAAMGPHLVPDYDSETGEGIHDFSWHGCDCCDSPLGGELHRFAILGEENASRSEPSA